MRERGGGEQKQTDRQKEISKRIVRAKQGREINKEKTITR